MGIELQLYAPIQLLPFLCDKEFEKKITLSPTRNVFHTGVEQNKPTNKKSFSLSQMQQMYQENEQIRAQIEIREVVSCSFGIIKHIVLSAKRNLGEFTREYRSYILFIRGSKYKEQEPIELQKIKRIDLQENRKEIYF